MKLLNLIFLTGLILTCKLSLGQISQGGVPYSFKSNLKSTISNSIMLSEDVPIVEMPSISKSTIDVLKEYNKKEQDSYQFAYGFDVNINVKDNAVVDSLECGYLYRITIKSTGAYSINIIFKEFLLPLGAKLFIYNESHDYLIGAFTSNNNSSSKIFPVLPVKGDKIFIEYFEPYFSEFKGSLIIGKISHDFLDVLNTQESDDFGKSGDCEVDINCTEGNNWQTEKRAVCRILYDGNSWCTGTLINNTNIDGTPYFLTANHCVSTQDQANKCVFIFNYESPSCGGGNGSVTQSISGATLRATGANSDFTLLELSKPPFSTYKPYFAGWDRNDAQSAGGVCIHHPAGDVKKISTFNIVPPNSNCFNDRPNANFYRMNWVATTNGHGVTEGGSSGSPLFNNQKHVIGQLYGAGLCSNTNCSNPANDVSNYGKLFASWNLGNSSSGRLRDWLDPNNNTFVLNGVEGCNQGAVLNLNLNNTIASGSVVTFQATNNIEASNTIETGATVTYEAGNQITLNPGFNSQIGSQFEAKIRNFNCVVTCDPINLVAWTSIACSGSGLCFNISGASSYSVSIYSISGAKIFSGSGNINGSSVCVWSASGIATGIYIATVKFSSNYEEISNTYRILVSSCNKSSTLKSSIDSVIINETKLALPLSEIPNKQFDFDVYPNPNDGVFTLKLNSTNLKPYSIDIFNSTGMNIYQIEHSNAYQININILGLVKGFYYVRLSMGRDFVTKKIVVQ